VLNLPKIEPRLLNSQLCFALYSANKNYNHFYQAALEPFSLTYAQYITLLALWEESPLTVKKLGSKLNLDSGTLTPLLKRLEKQGWVIRKRSKNDERQVNVSLTELAVKNRDEVYDRVNNCMNIVNIPNQEYHDLIEELQRIGTKLEAAATSDKIKTD